MYENRNPVNMIFLFINVLIIDFMILKCVYYFSLFCQI